MPLNRRHFLRYAAALGAAAVLPSVSMSGAPLPEPPSPGGDEESYWQDVRSLFPLAREGAYLNTGTLGPSPYPVIEATRQGMMKTDEFGYYNGYEDIPKKLAAFLGVLPDEIALTHNTTEGINIMCRGVPLRSGDEVILSTHEHVGNAFPWLNRAQQEGIVLRAFSPGDDAASTLAQLHSVISRRTKVVAIPHLPCTQGQLMPLAEICSLARQRGIFTMIDGAHAAGMIALDLHATGADAYAGCCHKWMLGPKGTGFLYVRKDFQEVLKPHFVGAGGDDARWNMATVPPHGTAYADGAHRYWGGTQNLGLWLGVGASVDFLTRIGAARIEQRVRDLGTYTRERLSELGKKVQIVTPAEACSRAGITGFRVAGMAHDRVFKECMDIGLRIRAVSENGWNALRVSTHFFNFREEIDRLAVALEKMK